MEFSTYFVVFLRKGPKWTGDPTAELSALQSRHLAHLSDMHNSGKMVLSGPIEAHTESDLRGISIYTPEQIPSQEHLKTLVEADPMIQIGHLAAEYVTWYLPENAVLHS